jgi:HTH-type transcriptional regulator/antitoxin HigA
MLAYKLEEVAQIWSSVESIFSVPKTEAEYNKLVNFLDEVSEKVGEDESHPLVSLMDTLGILIEIYENEHYNEPQVTFLETLVFLMEEHGLKNKDLQEIGDENFISEILSGKRELNQFQIKQLSKRFNVSPSVFLDI